ncbi:unnamed protein product, partial [marine sediment metagenome]
LMVLWTAPVLAAGLSISPPTVEFDVPADGSAEVEFLVYDFTGDLQISLEDIPLRVEPTTVPVTAKEGGTRIVLTFYGDESLGSEIYEGKIRFLAMTGGTVAMGIKVRATVNHIATGQPPLEEAPEETTTEESPTEQTPEEAASGPEESPPEQAPTGESEQSSPTPSESSSFPVLPVAGIAAGTIIIITLIIVIVRRYQY